MRVPTIRRSVALARTKLRDSELGWSLSNARSRFQYLLDRPQVDDQTTALVASLKRDGIAIVDGTQLLGNALVDELAQEVAAREAAQPDVLAAHRSETLIADHKARYRFSLLGLAPRWEPDSIFARFALAPGIRDVANAYYGLNARLRYYNVWRTFPTSSPPGDSQLWHRDREDRWIFKAFFYLTDVDQASGALSYVPGTHGRGSVRVAPEAFKEPGHSNLRSRDDQMERVAPPATWRIATGKRGTLVFVDTSGYHKGGFSTTHERNVFTCMYTSPASIVGDLFTR